MLSIPSININTTIRLLPLTEIIQNKDDDLLEQIVKHPTFDSHYPKYENFIQKILQYCTNAATVTKIMAPFLDSHHIKTITSTNLATAINHNQFNFLNTLLHSSWEISPEKKITEPLIALITKPQWEKKDFEQFSQMLAQAGQKAAYALSSSKFVSQGTLKETPVSVAIHKEFFETAQFMLTIPGFNINSANMTFNLNSPISRETEQYKLIEILIAHPKFSPHHYSSFLTWAIGNDEVDLTKKMIQHPDYDPTKGGPMIQLLKLSKTKPLTVINIFRTHPKFINTNLGSRNAFNIAIDHQLIETATKIIQEYKIKSSDQEQEQEYAYSILNYAAQAFEKQNNNPAKIALREIIKMLAKKVNLALIDACEKCPAAVKIML
jgi:hypothetical protein